jgi:hypothetical protein
MSKIYLHELSDFRDLITVTAAMKKIDDPVMVELTRRVGHPAPYR